MYYDPVPSASALEEPTYQALCALGGRGFHKDVSATVIDMYDLYHALEYDSERLFKNLAFARSQLKSKGWIDNPHQGMWQVIAYE